MLSGFAISFCNLEASGTQSCHSRSNRSNRRRFGCFISDPGSRRGREREKNLWQVRRSVVHWNNECLRIRFESWASLSMQLSLYKEQKPLILDDVWTIDEKTLANNPGVTDSGFWRFMLINDGHIMRVIRILTKARSKLNVLESSLLGSDVYVPFLNQALPGRWRRRQITITDAVGTVLVYVVSWWKEDTFLQIDKQVDEYGGWDYYDLVHWEVARKVRGLHFGLCSELESLFRVPGPYWAKSYTFKIGLDVRVFNYEVLSPGLSRYIGIMTYPKGSHKYLGHIFPR